MTIVGQPPVGLTPLRTSGPKPLRSRYLLAALLVIAGVVGAAGWASARSSASDSDYFRNAHAGVPGVLNISAHPGLFKVFVENGTLTSVRVTDATGAVIPLTMFEPPKAMPNYGGHTIKEVARFELKPGNKYVGPTFKVEATGSATAFAVGESGNASEYGNDIWGIIALLVVNIAAAAAIVLAPILRQRHVTGTP